MQSLRVRRYVGKIRFTRIALAIAFAAMLVAAAKTGESEPAVTSQLASGPVQSLLFPYWSIKGGFSSTIGLNNASDEVLIIYPTVYSSEGVPIEAAPVTLGPRKQSSATISEWIAGGGGDSSFGEGSLILRYAAPEESYVGAQIRIANVGSRLSVDVPDEKPSIYSSSRLEGLWWQPDSRSQFKFVVTETAGQSVAAEIRFTGDQRRPESVTHVVSLSPHESRVLNLGEMKLPFSSGHGHGKLGGITVEHTGKPGGVIAYGMLVNESNGFSTQFRFEDPEGRRTDSLIGAHVLVGSTELPGLPSTKAFSAMAALRNTTGIPMEVSPVFTFDNGEELETVNLPKRRLGAHQINAIDLGSALSRAGFRGPFPGAGLMLRSSGELGSLVAHLSCFDEGGDYAFTVPMKDPGLSLNSRGGSYPWGIDGDLQSIVHIRNTTDKAARFTIQLDFDGGSYTLPMQEVGSHQQASINIRELRDEQVKDSIGRVIPLEVRSGQATWSERGPQALIGRLEMYSPGSAVSSTLSCGIICCQPSSEFVICSPESFIGLEEEILQVHLLETQRRACDGAEFGPFDVTPYAGWSSGNTSVATVAIGEVHLVAVGQAQINAVYNGSQFQYDPAIEVCEFSTVPMEATSAVAVARVPKIRSISQTIIDESQQGAEVVECGRFRITIKYDVSCPPANSMPEVIGNIELDAVLLCNESHVLTNNDNNEVCTYEIKKIYRMKNRLSQDVGTGFTSYSVRVTDSGRTTQKAGPGLSVRATIPGTGPCEGTVPCP